MKPEEENPSLEPLPIIILLTVHTWEVFLFITHCLQSTAPLKDMQVHSSVYLLFSPQEFNCFSA